MSSRPLLDTRLGVETPEGVLLELRPAGIVPRFGAFVIDFIFRVVMYMMLAMALGYAGEFGTGIFLIGLFLIEWFYPVVFEVWRRGATPGKRVMGIAVVEDNGLPVTFASSVVRNLLRFVDFLPFLYGVAIVSMLLTRDFKRLGDLAAGTRVVYVDPPARRRVLPEVMPLAPARIPRPEVQQAVIELAERSTRLTPERLRELCELAGRAIGLSGHDVSESRIFAMAAWLLGRRSPPPPAAPRPPQSSPQPQTEARP
ncbi:MAG: RDD family protein [Burkholderiales bacterium]|nr:RDD family protein [Burkholderiales bacterium]